MAAPSTSRAARAKRPARKLTAAERKHLSEALRGKHRTAAQKKAESARLKGKKHPHKGHKATAKEKAALARGRALAKLHHHQLSARQKAVLAKGRAAAKAAEKGRKLTARQQAALARARTRKHTAAERAAESARMKAAHRKPPRGLRPTHRPGGHLEPGTHPGKRSGRVVAAASRTRRIYPSKFGGGHHRVKSQFVHGRAGRIVHAPYARGRHHIKNWGSRGR